MRITFAERVREVLRLMIPSFPEDATIASIHLRPFVASC